MIINKLCNLLSRNNVKLSNRFISTINKYTDRTHTCGQLNKSLVGKRVNICGWIQHTRFRNKILTVRDSYGTIQCIVANPPKMIKITNESVVRLAGIVYERPEDQINPEMASGDIEIIADEIEIMSLAKAQLPMLTRDYETSTHQIRLANRYMDLRTKKMQRALRFRSEATKIFRDKLHSLAFVECETPTLFARTPGGANEFIVPTREPNLFYTLVQSPQQLKQMLMIGGLDRYYQICRCYRDEATRADRQPEFTQVDIELSFTSQFKIMKLIEDLLYDLAEKLCPKLKDSYDSEGTLDVMSFEESIRFYGTDKPDRRFKWLIENDMHGSPIINIPHHVEKSDFYEDDINIECLNGKTVLRSTKADISRVHSSLGRARCQVAKSLEKKGFKVYEKLFDLLWVKDFPLFELGENGKFEPNHHPFTAPDMDTIEYLDTEPGKVIAQSMDLVLNGQEVGGGSVRIHDARLQSKIFRDILKIEEDKFDYFLTAMRAGCPPHGGIAIGLDRLIAILLQEDSIREVIAFPKSTLGRDLITGCPQNLEPEVLKKYHLVK